MYIATHHGVRLLEECRSRQAKEHMHGMSYTLWLSILVLVRVCICEWLLISCDSILQAWRDRDMDKKLPSAVLPHQSPRDLEKFGRVSSLPTEFSRTSSVPRNHDISKNAEDSLRIGLAKEDSGRRLQLTKSNQDVQKQRGAIKSDYHAGFENSNDFLLSLDGGVRALGANPRQNADTSLSMNTSVESDGLEVGPGGGDSLDSQTIQCEGSRSTLSQLSFSSTCFREDD
jgi:hypothetical protein